MDHDERLVVFCVGAALTLGATAVVVALRVV